MTKPCRAKTWAVLGFWTGGGANDIGAIYGVRRRSGQGFLDAKSGDWAILTWGAAPPKHRAPTAGPLGLARAQMAELVDALVSGTSAARRGGSSPLLGTI